MGETVIEVRDTKDSRPIPYDLRNKNRYKSVASDVIPNPLDVDYLYDEDYELDKSSDPLKRLYTLRHHKNGTFYKYSINNRLMDKSSKEDSLQSMNGSACYLLILTIPNFDVAPYKLSHLVNCYLTIAVLFKCFVDFV